MTLKEFKHFYVHYILKKNKYNRSEAAAELGISPRSLRHYIAEFKNYGISDDFVSVKEKEASIIIDDVIYKYKFPTNEERLAYLDR
jgi:predicted transcriptional regulator